MRLTQPSSSPAATQRLARSLPQLPRPHAGHAAARRRAPLRVAATAPAAKPATAAAPVKPTPPAKDRWHKPAAATAEAAEGSSATAAAAAVPAPSNGATSSGDDEWPAQTGVLLIKCDDSKGVVASVAQVGARTLTSFKLLARLLGAMDCRRGCPAGRPLNPRPPPHMCPLLASGVGGTVCEPLLQLLCLHYSIWSDGLVVAAAESRARRQHPQLACDTLPLPSVPPPTAGCRHPSPSPALPTAAVWLWLQHPVLGPVFGGGGEHVLPGADLSLNKVQPISAAWQRQCNTAAQCSAAESVQHSRAVWPDSVQQSAFHVEQWPANAGSTAFGCWATAASLGAHALLARLARQRPVAPAQRLASCCPRSTLQRVVFDYSDMLVGPGNTGAYFLRCVLLLSHK